MVLGLETHIIGLVLLHQVLNLGLKIANSCVFGFKLVDCEFLGLLLDAPGIVLVIFSHADVFYVISKVVDLLFSLVDYL